jgi:hypothetical protein
VSNPGTNNGQNGILVDFGTIAADAGMLCLRLGGSNAGEPNIVTGSGIGGASDIRMRARFDTTVALLAPPSNYAGGALDTTAVQHVPASKNAGPSVSSVALARRMATREPARRRDDMWVGSVVWP